jgi:hypothetical protein
MQILEVQSKIANLKSKISLMYLCFTANRVIAPVKSGEESPASEGQHTG